MMSESQENQSLNLWNGSHLWSGVDVWYPPPDQLSISLSDVSGGGNNMFGQGCDKGETKPVTSPLPNWSPTALLHGVEKPSIWSAGENCPSETTNLSLSDNTNQWSLISQNPGTWDAPKDSLLLDLPTSNLPTQSWNSNQLNTTSGNPEVTHLSTSNCPIAVSDSNFTDFVPKDNRNPAVSEIEDISEKCVLPGASDESAKLATLSTEQLCDHLINSHDGWGRRPINQLIPWDTSSLVKLNGDQSGRSGIATPTPGTSSTSLVGTAYRLPSAHGLESNSWNNEPLNGTAIWEKYYDRLGDQSGVWSSAACGDSSTSVDSICSTGNLHVTATPLLLVNNSGPTQSGRLNSATATQSFQRSTTSLRDWDSDNDCDLIVRFNSTPPKPELWMPDGNATPGIVGRPLLGGMRCASNQMDEGLSTWCNSDASVLPNNSFDNGSSNSSWINTQTHAPLPSGGVAAAMHWNANNTSLMTATSIDEVKRRHANLLNSISTIQPNTERLVAHTYSNTYRADLVKLLTSHGFRKEDAHAALINCNMEPERALNELRERYKQSGSYTPCYGLVTPPPSNAQSLQQQNTVPNNSLGQLPGGPVYPAAGSNINGPGAFSANRGKQSNSNNQSINMVQQPNQQLVRQQFMQQMRSAFTLSLPGGSNSSAANTVGNSLLGQPPPPTLNGINPSSGSHTHQSNSSNHNGNNNVGSLLSRGPNAAPPTVTPLVSVSSHNNNNTKRSPRQTAIISAIQELQKKHQSIQNQIHVYKNNPTMRAQPQYADVFAELQGQMHQIEAQVKAKQAQLNLACSQDSAAAAAAAAAAAGFRGQQQSQSATSSPLDGHSLSSHASGNGIQAQRFTQDQLVQQLSDLRLRANNNNNTVNCNDQVDQGEFPVIGMWTPHNKGGDIQDKYFDHSSGPRSLVGSRGCASGTGSRSQQHQQSPSSSGWQTAGSWSNHHVNNNGSSGSGCSANSGHMGQQQQQHQRYGGTASMAMQWTTTQGGNSSASQFNQTNGGGGGGGSLINSSNSCAGLNTNQQSMSMGNFAVQHQTTFNQGFGSGPQSLDQPTTMGQWVLIQPLVGNPPPKLSILHNLLATQYGLTNLHVINQNSACVLARLQSKDSAFQLMRNLNTRLSIDLLQESEVIAYMQRTNSCGGFASNGISQSSELSISSGPTGNTWLGTADSTPLPPGNSAAGFFSRRSNAQNNQRFGTVTSGLH